LVIVSLNEGTATTTSTATIKANEHELDQGESGLPPAWHHAHVR
jgi:hypothetical protein